MNVRRASRKDLSRVAEILVFNNRVNFLPIFKDPLYSFGELQVEALIDDYFSKKEVIENLYVYDDGIVKGFILMSGKEIEKLYVDTFFQSGGIGYELLRFAIDSFGANRLWALEKNERALTFYKKHGFVHNGNKKLEEDTVEYLLELERK